MLARTIRSPLWAKTLSYLVKIFYSQMDFRICIKFTSLSLKYDKLGISNSRKICQSWNLDLWFCPDKFCWSVTYTIRANGFVFSNPVF